jgi:hypothetical protein
MVHAIFLRIPLSSAIADRSPCVAANRDYKVPRRPVADIPCGVHGSKGDEDYASGANLYGFAIMFKKQRSLLHEN